MALYSMKKPSAEAEGVGFTAAAVRPPFAGSERKMESSALSRERSSVTASLIASPEPPYE